MKKLAATLALLFAGFAFVACGGGEEEITPDNLAAAMDEVCAESNATFDDLGTRGLTNPALALEFEGMAEVRQSVVDDLNELNVNEEAQSELDEYIAASEETVAVDKQIAKAAADDDTAAVNEAFTAQEAAFARRDRISKRIGHEVCGQYVDIKVEETGTGPPDDLDYEEPKNTVEEAADRWLKAGYSGSCVALNRNRHTDAGELEIDGCEAASEALKGATIAGVESYGPVGQAEIVGADGTHYPTFFVNDLDSVLRYAGDAIHDSGGLRPAPEDNDADATAEAVVNAIRDNDVPAFNATLPDESSLFVVKGDTFDTFSGGNYNPLFVKDIRDTDVEPVPLGLNSAYGYYFVEGSEYDWVVSLIHNPGAGGNYRFAGYYPIPKAG